MFKKPKFSILDLSPITEGNSAKDAMLNSINLAQNAEEWGFNRYWLAEHHNMPGIASAATAVLIGQIASSTKSIRVGSGGVMLPNHSPLVIAEQFGTLGSLYPNRIDLGVGRAPGTDQLTMHALRRSSNMSVDDFPQDVLELQNYFKKAEKSQTVIAIPAEGTDIPIYILGSSLFGAQLAGMLGLPFAFASHFAPQLLYQAIEIYRETFKPSLQLKKPYVMLGYNVFIGSTDQEANFLRSSSMLSFVNLRKGKPIKLPKPTRKLNEILSPNEKLILSSMDACSAVGNLDTIKNQLIEFIEKTKVDELLLVSSIYNHDDRLNSYKLLSKIFNEFD